MNREELIQAYFEQGLSPEEQERFDELRQNDPSFQEQLAFEKNVQAVARAEERKSLKKQLKNIPLEEDNSSSSGGRVHPLYYRLAAVAAVAAVVLLMWTVFSPSESMSSDMLYARYFKPYDNVVQPLERGEALESLERLAFEAYEFGNYRQADSLFTALQEQNDQHYFVFYRGISLMQLEDYKEAATTMESYLEMKGPLSDRARWYLSLCYLKLEQNAAAVSLLEELMDQGGYKAQQAEELLGFID